MYGYIYKTTNLINNKIYIGQHKSEVFDETYFGSGKMITEALHKYGKNNFKCEILEWCESKQDADAKEKLHIAQNGLPNYEIGYNITKGGQLRFFTGMKHDENTKLKMSNRAKNRLHPGTSNGHIWYNDGTHSKCISRDKVPQYEQNGWVKGRLFNECYKPWNKGLTVDTDERVKKHNDTKKQIIANGGTYGFCGIKGKDHYRYDPEKIKRVIEEGFAKYWQENGQCATMKHFHLSKNQYEYCCEECNIQETPEHRFYIKSKAMKNKNKS